MKVVLRREGTVKEITGNHKVKNILRMLEINPENVLVLKNKQLLTPDVTVKDDEEIEIWPVTSGG